MSKHFCPHCLSQVNEFATTCRHCTKDMIPSSDTDPPLDNSGIENLIKFVLRVVGIQFLLVLIMSEAFHIDASWPYWLAFVFTLYIAVAHGDKLP